MTGEVLKWADIKKKLSSIQFIDELKCLDVSKIKYKSILKAKSIIEDITHEHVHKASKSAAGLFLFA